jgi:hypothetical protein
MASLNESPLARLSSRDGRRILRNLVGGAAILAVWLALWAWFAAGVLRPLAALPRLAAERPAAVEST